MGRGKVVIEAILDDTKLREGLKSLQGGGFASGMFGRLRDITGFALAYRGINSAITAVTGSFKSLIGEMNSSNKAWASFEGNMAIMGKTREETLKAKQEMQDFATKTIYSASDMASTYAQLAAVGIENTDKLVKGFGGLAASAENPKQAMKTLSQQATQMAARPTVAWEDFRLILQQAPSAMASIAKKMGMTTDELVAQVRKKQIATKDFFDAVIAVGNSDEFQNMATKFRSTGEAIDGLRETLANKLMPVFQKLDGIGIGVVTKLTDAIGNLNFDKLVGGIDVAIEKILGIVPAVVAVQGAFALANGSIPVLTKMATGGLGVVKAFSALPHATIGSFFEGLNSSLNVSSKSLSMFGAGFNKTMSVGLNSTSMMTSAIGNLAMAGLGLVGPVALIGAGIAGAGIAMNLFGDQITGVLNTAITQGPTIIASFVNGIISQLPQLINTGVQMITMLGTAISTNLPVLAQKAVELIQTLVNGVSANLPQLIATGIQIVTSLINSLISAIPQLMLTGMQFILSLVQGVIGNMGNILTAGQSIIDNLSNALQSYLPQIISTGIEIIVSLITGIANNLPALLNMGLQLIMTLFNAIMSSLPQIIQGAIAVVRALVSGIVQNIPAIIKTASTLITNFLSGIYKMGPQILVGGFQIIVELLSGLFKAVPSLISGGLELAGSLMGGIWDGITSIGSDIVDWFSNWWDNLWGGAKDTAKEHAEEIKNTTSDMGDSMKETVSDTAKSVNESMDGMNRHTTSSTRNAVDETNAELARLKEGAKNVEGFAFDAKKHMEGVKFELPNEAMYTAEGVNQATKDGLTPNPYGFFTDGALAEMARANGILPAMAGETTQAVGDNIAPVGTFADFYAQLSPEAQAYLGEYDAVVDLMTAETANTAFANTGEVMSMTEWYKSLPEWTRNSLSEYGVTVDSLTAQTAQTAVDNTAKVSNASTYWRDLHYGATAEVQAMKDNVTAQTQATANTVVSNANSMNNKASSQFNAMNLASAGSMIALAGASLLQSALINTTVTSNFKTMQDNAKNSFDNIKSNTTNAMNSTREAISSTLNTMKSQFSSGMNQIQTTARSAMSNTLATIRASMSNAVSAVRSAMSSAVSAMMSAGYSARSAGYNMGQGFYGGLASMAGSIISLAHSIASQAASAMRSALRIHSPSRVTDEIGRFTGEGLAIGMERQANNVMRSANLLAESAIPRIPVINPNVAMGLSGAYGGVASATTINRSVALNIDKFINNAKDDVQRLVREISWVEQQALIGGVG